MLTVLLSWDYGLSLGEHSYPGGGNPFCLDCHSSLPFTWPSFSGQAVPVPPQLPWKGFLPWIEPCLTHFTPEAGPSLLTRSVFQAGSPGCCWGSASSASCGHWPQSPSPPGAAPRCSPARAQLLLSLTSCTSVGETFLLETGVRTWGQISLPGKQ